MTLLAALCASAASAADPKPVLKVVADRFVSPTSLAPIDRDRLLVCDQVGRLFIVGKDGSATNKLALLLTPQMKFKSGGFDERGLVGLAVHPKFSENGRIYLSYSAPLRETADTNWDHSMHVSEFTLKKDEAGDERILLSLDLPYSNHHSGRMTFGPDGLLYISVGDGGNANDVGRGHSPQGNGQDTTKLLGKVLRIDVDRKDQGKEYGIPKDNPFVGNGKGQPEIFAWGFRNPWGLCFDRGGDRQLFLADVGQDSWEEVDIVTKGGNYGWNIREGFVCFNPSQNRNPPADCPKKGAMGEPLIDPILAYKNFGKYAKDPEARGISITGGYVYRGKLLPQLTGKYVFGDWSRGWAKPDGVLYVASRSADGKWTMEPLALANHPEGTIGAYITALGEDADGELYVLSNDSNSIKANTGKVWKLVASE